MSYILALDLGTTGNRALAIDKNGQVVASSYYEFPQLFPKPGWVEHDPHVIWETVHKAMLDVIERVGVSSIEAIGITNQRETTILWDSVTGEPLYNAIVWQCRRTSERCRELASYSEVIKNKTGLFLDPYFSATKIEWIFKNCPEANVSLQHNRLKFGTIDSWIVWKLTAGRSHITDISNASRTLLFNIHTCDYDSDLLSLFAIPKNILPIVVDSSGVVAYTDASILGKSIPISGIIGDQQAALFTQCGNRQDLIKNTYGTGLFIVANTGCTPLSTERLISTIAWKKNNAVTYAVEGSIFVGGSAIQWLRDGLQLLSNSSESEHYALSIQSNEGVYFVPALSGLGAPHWDPTARGMFIGLTRGTSKAHMIRAALESMAYQTRDVFEQLTQQKFKALRVDGGASSNSFLMQFQSDILGIPIEKPRIIETTAFGAAGMAGLGISFWSENEFSLLNPIETVFNPLHQDNSFQTYYSDWQRAVQRTLLWSTI